MFLSARLKKVSRNTLMGMSASSGKYPIYCDNSVMRDKAHGTCEKGVMTNLRWKCNRELADRICCFNRWHIDLYFHCLFNSNHHIIVCSIVRHYAENSGYWESTPFLKDVRISQYLLHVSASTSICMFNSIQELAHFLEWLSKNCLHMPGEPKKNLSSLCRIYRWIQARK